MITIKPYKHNNYIKPIKLLKPIEAIESIESIYILYNRDRLVAGIAT